MEKLKALLQILGSLLLLLAAAMILPLLTAWAKNETPAIYGLGVSVLICGLTGAVLCAFSHREKYSFKHREGFLIAACVWLTGSLAGMLPYALSGSIPGFFDALFESASGFTTTGATVLNDVEGLPDSIILWRSLTGWLGGMGVLAFLSSLLPSWGTGGQGIAFNESSGITGGKFGSRFTEAAKLLLTLYIIITSAQLILLKLSGMNWLDSVVYAFGTVSTCGFSSHNGSFAYLASPVITAIMIVFMLPAGINNLLLVYIARHDAKRIIREEETGFFFMLTAIITLLIFICNAVFSLKSGESVTFRAFTDALFQTVSVSTTTGYYAADYGLWPTFSQMLLFAAFFTGGSVCSVSGGVKSLRILTSLKLVKRSFSVRLHPNRIAELTYNGKAMPSDNVIRMTTYVFTYIMVLFAGTFLISFNGMDLISDLSAAAACLGNIGPGFGSVGPFLSYGALTGFTKVVCSLLMIIGRLEMLAVFTLFSKYYWNTNRSR